MAPMTSSTWPRRPSLIFDTTFFMKFWSARKGRVIGVSMKVGQMVLMRMPCGPSSIAIAFVKPSTANFEAL
jgi:hypothetical protein